jgi:hypothetical protein
MKFDKPKSLAAQWVTFNIEEDPANDAKFYLRPLTTPELHQVREYLYRDADGVERLSSAGAYRVIKLALLDWANVEDEDGNPWVFDSDWSKIFNALPIYMVDLLSLRAMFISTFTEEDQKKLLQRSKSEEIPEPSIANAANTEGTATKKTRRRTPSSRANQKTRG